MDGNINLHFSRVLHEKTCAPLCAHVFSYEQKEMKIVAITTEYFICNQRQVLSINEGMKTLPAKMQAEEVLSLGEIALHLQMPDQFESQENS